MPTVLQKIRLAHYLASDGPRLVLFGPLNVDLRSLRDCFLSLCRRQDQLRIDLQSFVVPYGGVELYAHCLESSSQRSQAALLYGLRRTSTTMPHFEWTQSPDEWENCADLLEGLLKTEEPAHQYLAADRIIDAIIVVSKGEYGDNVLSV